MANVYQNLTMVATKAVIQVENNMVTVKKCRRDWDDEFGVHRKKIGATFQIRKTPRTVTTSTVDIGTWLASTGPGYQDPNTVSLTLNNNIIAAITMPDQEWLLSFDMEDDRVIDPYSVQMANDYDRLVTAKYKDIGNYSGQPGTALTTTALKTFAQGRAGLNKTGVPTKDRHVIYDPDVAVEAGDSLRTNFNPQSNISAAMRASFNLDPLGYYGMDWEEDPNLYTHTCGNAVGLVTAAVSTTVVATGIGGVSTVATNGWTNGAGNGLLQGDVVTFGTLGGATARLAVNPLTRASLNYLLPFAVTAAIDPSGGIIAIPISPALQGPTITGGAANPLQNISGFPTIGDVVRVFGQTAAANVAGKQSNTSFIFHRDAFAVACVELPKFDGLNMCGRATDDMTGLSIRVAQQYNLTTTQLVTRMDSLCAVATVEPSYVWRVQTT